MSEQPVDEELERQYVEAAQRGLELAAMMIGAVNGQPCSATAMLNAIGNIVEQTFTALPMCDQHQLEEYDNWCAYTRTRIEADQQGEGETRQ